MAIIKSLAIGKAKGSMGNITYAYLGGDTIGKGKIAFPKIPRTYAQMTRRTKWANIVNLWQTLTIGWHPSFEDATGRVSDYNMFLSRNINGPAVFLSKEEANAGGSVAAGYMITDGSLPTIQAEISNGVLSSGISIGLEVLDEETTLGAFSRAVIENNIDFVNGDQITYVYFIQYTNATTGIPFVMPYTEEITLNTGDNDTLLMDIVTAQGFSIQGDKLASGQTINGAAAYVHSRIVNGQTLVSKQYLIVANSILSAYQSTAARDSAIISYGGKLTQPYLTPNIEYTEAPTGN